MHIMTPFLRLLEDSPGEIKKICQWDVYVDLIKVVSVHHSELVRSQYAVVSVLLSCLSPCAQLSWACEDLLH